MITRSSNPFQYVTRMTRVSPHRPYLRITVTDVRIVLFLDLDVSIVAEEDMTRSFVFDFTKPAQATNAVVFARQLLLQEIAKRHYNMLLTEG